MSENVWDLSVRIAQGGKVLRSLTIPISGTKKVHDLKVSIFRSTKIRLNDMRISLGETPLEDNNTLLESGISGDSIVVCNVTGSVGSRAPAGELRTRQEGDWMIQVKIQHNNMAATKPLAVHPDRTVAEIKRLIHAQYKLSPEIQAIFRQQDDTEPVTDDVRLGTMGISDGGMIFCKIVKAPAAMSKKQSRRERRHSRQQSVTNRVVNVAATAKAIFEDLRARGEVYIGDRTVIGPGVNLNAEKGPIRIGSDCILSDNVQIINKTGEELVIGNFCLFEPAAKIEAARIGHHNIFGAKCHVMTGVIVGSGCVIGPRVQVIQKTKVKDSYVVFGMNMMQENKEIRLRNATYIKQMVAALNKKFEQQKETRPPGKGQSSSRGRGDRHRSRRTHRERGERSGERSDGRSDRSDRSVDRRSDSGRSGRRSDTGSESGGRTSREVMTPEELKRRQEARAQRRASGSIPPPSAAAAAGPATGASGLSKVEEIRERMRQRKQARMEQQKQQGGA